VTPLGRDFFERDALEVAPELLGKVLVVGECSARIVEVEAYRSDEPASHTFRGRTPRNAVMFGEAGHLYVYFTYGMHHCTNVVTGWPDDGQGVLLRAVVPLGGLEVMRSRRPAGTPTKHVSDGPGKLSQALGLTLADSGTDACDGGSIWFGDDGTAPPVEPLATPRIGITKAVDLPWRFLVPPAISPEGRTGRPARGTRRGPASVGSSPATS
jgi:DNA-3-methyladenine glycosylase